jgi:hypothetical protein
MTHPLAIATVFGTALLSGCALTWVPQATEAERSDEKTTVISGRLNYVVDGQPMAPYDQPGWSTPRFMALSLTTGDPQVMGEVRASDGTFRRRLPPGAYVVSRAGVLNTDSEVSWPRLVLCVPRAPGQVVHVGHWQLVGQRHSEDVVLSTGMRYTSKGIRYRSVVGDEAAPGETVSLMRHVPDMPIGVGLQRRWLADPQGLERELCGAVLR